MSINIKNAVFATLALSMLSSCAFMGDKANGEPNAPWRQNVDYDDNLGGQEAGLATVSFSQGNFPEAEDHLINALTVNPRQPQALLVGALMYEQTGRINRARQYYEDLILVGGDRTSLLGSETGQPEKMTDIAKKRLHNLTMQQNRMVTEDKDGTKVFTVSEEASQSHGKSAMEEALFIREQKLISQNKAVSDSDRKAVELLFSDGEKNIISRFLIMKELAEKDLITKEEFLSARQTNLGGILPLTNQAPAAGIDKPVPSADVIMDRISALKEAQISRAITPREFTSERDLIIEAILPPYPRTRAKYTAPARDIMSAAKEMRKIEVIYDLGLITAKEKDAEQRAIEKHLGMNKNYKPVKKSAAAPKPKEPKKDNNAAAVAAPAAPKPTAPAVITPAPSVTTSTEPAVDVKTTFIDETPVSVPANITSPAITETSSVAGNNKPTPNAEACKELCPPTPLIPGISNPF